jgi:hypothetical protein
MAKPRSGKLFQLIKSMKKSEKRYFKLWVQREKGANDPKFLQLFGQIDEQVEYDEAAIEAGADYLTAGQLSNLKANLYTKILTSLKYYNMSNSPDMQTRELIDHAQLLFDRSLYQQCDSLLDKAWKMANKTSNLELQLMILKWKKNVLSQTAVRSNQEKTNAIIGQVKEVNNRINNINLFTNLQLQLNTIYLKTGFVRNEGDHALISELFHNGIKDIQEDELSLAEKSNLYSLFIDYYFFIQDFDKGYKCAKRWVDLFNNKSLIYANLETYIKALNSLLIAESRINAYDDFMQNMRKLRNLRSLPAIQINENINLKLFKYTYVHEFNMLFMVGDFSHGVHLMEKIKPRIDEYIARLDNHSRLIMYYKIACLYVGNSDYAEGLVWLNRIINTEQEELREDIHGFSRILSLICHYELGHQDIIDYHVRSTYRYLAKRETLQQFHKYILSFLKHVEPNLTQDAMKLEFKALLEQLLPLESNPYEKRAFIYFDIISWLEGKIQGREVQEVIQEKARNRLGQKVVA